MKDLLLMILLFIIITYVFGLIYELIDHFVERRIRDSLGWSGYCIFGAIGVPFHELSHLIMCIIFLHRVTDFSLFRPKKGREDGVLGYVNHSYSFNLYKISGNFFIGAAPLMLGIGVIILLFHHFYPQAFVFFEPVSLSTDGLKELLLNTWKFVSCIFCVENFKTVTFWLIFLFIVALSAHLDLSRAEAISSISGIPGFVIISIVISFIVNKVTGYSMLEISEFLFKLNILYIYSFLICGICNIFVGILFWFLGMIKSIIT